jgi:hypothetical protein
MVCLSVSAFAYNVDGKLSTSYEVYKDKGEDSKGLWENYLSIDNAQLINPYLNFNFYGKYADDDGDTYSDVYSAYLNFSSFQNALEMKAGRFSYIGNRFLTLDGAAATVRTDYKFGVSVFGGKPKYFDADGRHINEQFRKTGDSLYGGRVFINGVKNTTGYVSYSKESDDSETLQELVGAGLGRTFTLGSFEMNADGKVDYDTDASDIYRGTLRLYGKSGSLRLIGDFTKYNVKDGSAYAEELIITNWADGKEERYGFTAQYDVTENISPYVGAVVTEVEISSGEIVKGYIYKLGTDFNYFKTHGLTSNVEVYTYDSDISNARGAAASLEYSITKALRFELGGEYLRLENSKTKSSVISAERNIYSTYASAEYDLFKGFTLGVFGEKNKETRYLPEDRLGVKAEYSF